MKGIPLTIPLSIVPVDFAKNFWGGKIFTTDANANTTLKNILLPGSIFAVNDITADVSPTSSSISDGNPAILLNYANSNNILARTIRDEIREISPGLYLGKAHVKNGFLTQLLTGQTHTFVLWFALERTYP